MKLLNIILTSALLGSAALASPEGLETLRNTYRDQLAKIADEEMASMATAQEQYIAQLAALEKQFQTAGKLDPLLKAQEERKRFTADRVVEAQHIALGVPEISSLQNQYIAAVKVVPHDPARRRLTLAGFYERSLKKLEEDLTKQNDISGALEVKQEREGLAKRPEIAAAQQTVSDLNAAKPVAEKDPVPVVEDVPVVEEVKKPSVLTSSEKTRIQGLVKIRFNDFVDDIEDQDWDNALEFVDPAYVKESGEHVAKSVLKMKYGMAHLVGDDPGAKIRSKDIEVSEDGDKVHITPELWARNRSHSLQRMTWKVIDGQWYLSLSGADTPQKREQPDRRPFRDFRRRN